MAKEANMVAVQTQTLVLIEELGGQLGSWEAATYWARQVGGAVVSDWAGRPGVAPQTAEAALQAYRRHMEEQARLVAEWDQYLRDRQRRLREVGEEAFREAAEAGLRQQIGAELPAGYAFRGDS